MFLVHKLTSYIYSWIHSPQSYPTLPRHQHKKDRFLFSVQPPNQPKIQPKIDHKDNAKMDVKMEGKQERKEERIEEVIEEDDNDMQDFIMQMKNQEKQLKEVNNLMMKLESFEGENKNRFNRIDDIQQDIKQINCQINDYSINYERDILYVRETKYQLQLIDYPQITFERYRIINRCFQNTNNRYEKMKNVQKNELLPITYKDFKTLAMCSWLNDQIINNYIVLINDQLIQRKMKTRILHSQFYSMLGKGEKKVKSSLEKQKISPKQVIIASVHMSNHWIFIKIHEGIIQIFDSLRRDSVDAYENISTIRMYKIFANWYYGKDHTLELRYDFPQQNNGYDCGVMMLFGMKDVVRDYINWSFNVSDCKYKRYQLGNQILTARITGFD